MSAINFYQMTWCGDTNSLTYPAGLTRQSLIDGTAFENFYPIVQLGIQAVPGTRFFLNDSKYPVIVGPSGIWEIDASAGTAIRQLIIDDGSLILNENAQSTHGIIIDMMYAGEGI